MATKFKKGDNVLVIAGKDKGRTGVVLRMMGVKAYVEGINLVKKHVKPNPRIEQPGGIKEIEAAIDVSNLSLLDTLNKRSRIGFKFLEDGTKVRYFKSSNELVDV